MEQTFTIAQAGKLTGVTPYTLRYYERAGLIDNIVRDASGKRAYSAKDVEWITFLQLFRDMGMTIQEMRGFAELKRGGITTAPQRKAFLEQYQARLRKQIKEREHIIELVDLKLHILAKKIAAQNQHADSIGLERLMQWKEQYKHAD